MEIKGIYKLPNIKHVFFIVPSLEQLSDSLDTIQESKRRMEYFEHILRSKDHICPKEIPHWTLKVVSLNDFETVLKQQTPKGLVSPNQSCTCPEYLELLAINLCKNPDPSADSLDTKKVLSSVSDEDVIEVFI